MGCYLMIVTVLCFFGGMTDEEQLKVTDIIPFVKGKLPMMYLGVPLITKRFGVKDCKCLLDKILRLLKGFLWNKGEVSAGKAKVAWKNICRPKSCGGLGLKVLDIWNKTLLIKDLWNIVLKKDTLWVKLVNTGQTEKGEAYGRFKVTRMIVGDGKNCWNLAMW
ncbi:hypothetical protein CTI12_AA223380 [Artemisia annua]|uniref:RNA-directed DNA polymerase, eukaryota, Reverse transcriptase zinc-binding domain protein n=1 Tax=Artemisia annua TaxID=35608 RepID=A0A2U1NVP7_ARTAN|nr:hypothetical protein CTI12_AA223380 [Artemisia annua]